MRDVNVNNFDVRLTNLFRKIVVLSEQRDEIVDLINDYKKICDMEEIVARHQYDDPLAAVKSALYRKISLKLETLNHL